MAGGVFPVAGGIITADQHNCRLAFLYLPLKFLIASRLSRHPAVKSHSGQRPSHISPVLKGDNGKILQAVLEQLRALRERELRSNRKISDIDKEIARISEQNLVLVRLKSKGYVDSALYLSQGDEIEQRLRTLRRLRRSILDAASEDAQIQDTEIMLDCLEDGPQWLEEPSSELFEALVRRIVIISADTLKFTLLNGLELTEHIGRAVR